MSETTRTQAHSGTAAHTAAAVHLDVRPGLQAEILRHLGHSSLGLRMTAVGALIALPNGAGREGLERALADAEVTVRLAAVAALAALPNGAGREALALALADLDQRVQLAAAEALTPGMAGMAAQDQVALVVTAPTHAADRLRILAGLMQRAKAPADELPVHLRRAARSHADPAVRAGAAEVLQWMKESRTLVGAGGAAPDRDRSLDVEAAAGAPAGDTSKLVSAGEAPAPAEEPRRSFMERLRRRR